MTDKLQQLEHEAHQLEEVLLDVRHRLQEMSFDLEPSIEESAAIVSEVTKGKPTGYWRKKQNGEFVRVWSLELRDSVELGTDEESRNRNLREENQKYRQYVERFALALMNKKSLDDTVAFWQTKYDEVIAIMKHHDGLLGNFQSELANQKATQVAALQAKYGHGPTA